MGYTAPHTIATGELVTIGTMNTEWGGNAAFLANPPACRVYHNANQSIPTGVLTALAFNSERYDTDTMHSTVTANGRITFKTAGLFMFGANLEWATDSTSFRFAVIRLNGTTVVSNILGPPAAGVATVQAMVGTYKFAINDYIEVLAQQNSAGAINVSAIANSSPEFWATWIGLG